MGGEVRQGVGMLKKTEISWALHAHVLILAWCENRSLVTFSVCRIKLWCATRLEWSESVRCFPLTLYTYTMKILYILFGELRLVMVNHSRFSSLCDNFHCIFTRLQFNSCLNLSNTCTKRHRRPWPLIPKYRALSINFCCQHSSLTINKIVVPYWAHWCNQPWLNWAQKFRR